MHESHNPVCVRMGSRTNTAFSEQSGKKREIDVSMACPHQKNLEPMAFPKREVREKNIINYFRENYYL
jgi:hypothetical protein